MNNVVSPSISFKGTVVYANKGSVETNGRMDKQIVEAWQQKLSDPEAQKDLVVLSKPDGDKQKASIKLGNITLSAAVQGNVSTLLIKNEISGAEYKMTNSPRAVVEGLMAGFHNALKTLCDQVIEVKEEALKTTIDVSGFLPPSKAD